MKNGLSRLYCAALLSAGCLILTGLTTGASAAESVEAAAESADAAAEGSEAVAVGSDSAAGSSEAAAEGGDSVTEEAYGEAKYTYHLITDEHYDYLGPDDGSYYTIASVNYDRLAIDDEYDDSAAEGVDLTGVESALAVINADTDETTGTFLSEYKESAQERYDILHPEDEPGYYGGFSDENDLTVARADSRCLSVVRDRSQYLGGAHGYTLTTAYSFDAEDGRRLGIDDVVTDKDELAPLLAKELLKTHDPVEFDSVGDEDPEADLASNIRSLMEGNEYYEGDNDLHYVTWYADNGGVSFVFNAYDLAPYASGQFRCTLMANDYPDLLKPEYLYGPGSYAEEIALYTGYTVDGEELLIGQYEDEYQTVESVQVYYGSKSVDFEVWGYYVKAYLMTVPAGKYLYLDVTTDNDWHSIYVIDIGAEILKADELQGLGFMTDPLDPDHVDLATRSNLMSTYSIRMAYHVDPANGGALEPNETYYTVISYDTDANVLTLKQVAELDILDDPDDPDSRETHKETVAKGTAMKIVRTDNESVVDCLTDDGRYIRFTVEAPSGWPQIIDETWELEDLLDGIMFAG